MLKLGSYIHSTVSRYWREQSGQDLVEYALGLPILLLIIFGIIECGILIMSYNTIANAAREGARAGVLPVTASCNNTCISDRATTAATTLTTGLNSGAIQVTVNRPSTGPIQVQVSYTATLLTAPVIQAFGGNGTISLNAVATMNLE